MRDLSALRRYYLVLGTILVAVADFDLIHAPTYDFKWFFNTVGFVVLVTGIVWELIATQPTKIKRAEAFIVPMLDAVSVMLQSIVGVEIRIAVFLLEKNWLIGESKKIRICFHSSNMNDSPDLVVKFEKWQGLAGHVWGKKQSAAADLTVVQDQNIEYWNLDETQIALTKDIKAIFGAPITDPKDSNQLIGILTFDTKSEYLYSNPRKGRIFKYFSANRDFINTSTIIRVYIAIFLQYFNLLKVFE